MRRTVSARPQHRRVSRSVKKRFMILSPNLASGSRVPRRSSPSSPSGFLALLFTSRSAPAVKSSPSICPNRADTRLPQEAHYSASGTTMQAFAHLVDDRLQHADGAVTAPSGLTDGARTRFDRPHAAAQRYGRALRSDYHWSAAHVAETGPPLGSIDRVDACSSGQGCS